MLTVLLNHHWNTFWTRHFWWIKVCYDLFHHLGSYGNIIQFQISFREENRLRIPESSKLEFSEKFLANNFTLLYRNSPNIATASFWEVMDSFISVAYASLAVSRTLLQQLLDCLNFTLDWENLFCWYKRKKKFLWTIAAEQAAKNHGD